MIKGLGISMNIASFYFCAYYNMIIAYSLYYLILSFRTTLDWSKCGFEWASASNLQLSFSVFYKSFCFYTTTIKNLDCTDDFEHFLLKCDEADVYRDRNGICYNYSGPTGNSPIGWWDRKKRLEFKKPIFPSQDYYE